MDKNKIKSFVETIFDDMASAMTARLGYVGVKTGLFKAMQGQGAMTFEQIAQGISIGSINAPSCHNLLSRLGRYQ